MCPVIHVILTSGWEKKNQQRTYTEDHIEKKVHKNVPSFGNRLHITGTKINKQILNTNVCCAVQVN
jgi:hypothetical protein